MRTPVDPATLDPGGRSPERLRAHYEIERELADRLRAASPQERSELYGKVYDELFARVPDHPQHTVQVDPAYRQQAVAPQEVMLDDFLTADSTFLEVGAGDCALSLRLARRVRHVYAVEVSETIAATEDTPENFELLLTNGREIPVPPGSVTLAFSNQLMEHLHPDDALEQVTNIFRALAPGGAYFCLTPHALLGPADISAFFDDEPTGFHLREYTNGDLVRLFRGVGFARVKVLAVVAGRHLRLPAAPFVAFEWLVRRLPRAVRRPRVVRKLISPGGGVVALKA